MGPVCWSGVWERNSQGVLPLAHLSKQLIKPEITHHGQHGRRAVPGLENQSRATLRSGQEINRRLPRLSGVTVAPAAVIVLLNRRRKRPIRLGLENNLRGAFIPGKEGWSRGERRGGGGGRQQEGQTEGGGVRGLRGSKTCLAFTFFLFLWVTVALIFDEAGAGWASGAGHALQAALHQLAQLAAWSWWHHLAVLALTSTQYIMLNEMRLNAAGWHAWGFPIWLSKQSLPARSADKLGARMMRKQEWWKV